MTRALAELDSIDEVDVIIIARGGGSVEDLLPFSEETMVRAAANAHTPIVSAIGHEGDAPLLDLVADYRASTPTDAARRIAPDYNQEMDGIARAVRSIRTSLAARITREEQTLQMLVSRPVFQSPSAVVDSHRMVIDTEVMQMRRHIERRLAHEAQMLSEARASLTADLATQIGRASCRERV